MPKLKCNNNLSDNSSHVAHLNILLPGHKDEDVSYQPAEMDLQGLFHCCLHVVLLRSLHTKTQQISPVQDKTTEMATTKI